MAGTVEEKRPGRWVRACHNTRPWVYEIRLDDAANPESDYDIREVGSETPATRGVSAAYVRAEFIPNCTCGCCHRVPT